MSEAMRYTRGLSNRMPLANADRAASWLVAHPDEAHPVLLDVLRERGPETKRILQLLAQFGREEAVDAVTPLLLADDELLSFEAARCLSSHPSPRASQSLIQGLGGSLRTRKAAIEGLALRGDDSMCEAVAVLLQDADVNVRQRAVRAVKRLGCLTPQRLTELADDPSEEVRRVAVEVGEQ